MIIIDIICEAIGYGIAALMFLAIPIIIIAVPIIIIFCCIGANAATKEERQAKIDAKAAKRAKEEEEQLQEEEEQIRKQVEFKIKLEAIAKYDRVSFKLITAYINKSREHAVTALNKKINGNKKAFKKYQSMSEYYTRKVNELLDEAYNKIHKEV